jgi:hypothetical protein
MYSILKLILTYVIVLCIFIMFSHRVPRLIIRNPSFYAFPKRQLQTIPRQVVKYQQIRQLQTSPPKKSIHEFMIYHALFGADSSSSMKFSANGDSTYEIVGIICIIAGAGIGGIGTLGYNIYDFITEDSSKKRKDIAIWIPVYVLTGTLFGGVCGMAIGLTSPISIPCMLIGATMYGADALMSDSDKN